MKEIGGGNFRIVKKKKRTMNDCVPETKESFLNQRVIKNVKYWGKNRLDHEQRPSVLASR